MLSLCYDSIASSGHRMVWTKTCSNEMEDKGPVALISWIISKLIDREYSCTSSWWILLFLSIAIAYSIKVLLGEFAALVSSLPTSQRSRFIPWFSVRTKYRGMRCKQHEISTIEDKEEMHLTSFTVHEQSQVAHKKGSFLLCDVPTNCSFDLTIANQIIRDKKETHDKMVEEERKDKSLDVRKIGLDLIAQRKMHLGKNVSCFYADEGGLVVTEGKGCYLLELNGLAYLDCCNNVACVGHSEPRVVKAGAEALAQIQTNSRFLHPTQQRYVKKLLSTFPEELNTVYLVNSGSEANDLALRIGKAHAEMMSIAKKTRDVICLDSAYHGHTQALIDISPYKWYQSTNKKSYCPPTTHVASLPDSYRGKYRGMTVETGKNYADEVRRIVESNEGVGVFIAESVVGCGGQMVLPPGYLQECYDAVRLRGGVCIADEVQTGFARSGTHFWYFQTYGVVPDIVTLGKPMGNGYPVAAVVCRREVAESFAASGIEYFNTYGGNSVACSIAEAVYDVILEDNLMSNARKTGEYLIRHLSLLQAEFDWIGDVRGQGLFLGVEFVYSASKGDLRPFSELCKYVVDYLRYDNVIVSRDGPDHNVLKIKPPLVFGEKEADIFLNALQSALQEALSRKAFTSFITK